MDGLLARWLITAHISVLARSHLNLSSRLNSGIWARARHIGVDRTLADQVVHKHYTFSFTTSFAGEWPNADDGHITKKKTGNRVVWWLAHAIDVWTYVTKIITTTTTTSGYCNDDSKFHI